MKRNEFSPKMKTQIKELMVSQPQLAAAISWAYQESSLRAVYKDGHEYVMLDSDDYRDPQQICHNALRGSAEARAQIELNFSSFEDSVLDGALEDDF